MKDEDDTSSSSSSSTTSLEQSTKNDDDTSTLASEVQPGRKNFGDHPSALSLWRLEPEKSFSNWKIEVVHKSSPQMVDTYHVHKEILVSGPHRSSYFENLFQFRDNDDAEDGNEVGVTRIELEESSCVAFPYFLDYMYHYDAIYYQDNFPYDELYDDFFSEEVLAAVRHLSEYFGIKKLSEKILQSMGLNTSYWHSTFAMFYKESNLVYDDSNVFIEECVKAMAGQSPQDLLNRIMYRDEFANDDFYDDFFPDEVLVAVRHLCNVFGVKGLGDKILDSMDFSGSYWCSTFTMFYEEAMLYNDTAVMEECIKALAEERPEDLLSALACDVPEDEEVNEDLKRMVGMLSESQQNQVLVGALRNTAQSLKRSKHMLQGCDKRLLYV